MGKEITYKGVNLNKPDNISMRMVKEFIDTVGGDYCFSVEKAIEFLSNKIDKSKK